MLWTVAYQVPLSMGFSRQEYWGGLSWPPPGDLPNQGIEPMSPMSSAFSSIQFSHSVVSDSLQSHELQHIKLPCPSPTPRACSNSCPLSQWCHPTISSPVIPFSSCLQSFPESGSFPMSQIFTSGGQSGSFGFSISPSNDYSELISFMIVWFDLLAVQGTLKSLLQHHSSKASILWHSAFFIFQLSHPYMTTGKTIALTRQTFDSKVIPLLFNMLSRFVIAFLEVCTGMQVLLPLVPPGKPNYMCSQWFLALGKKFPGPCSLTEWKPAWKCRPLFCCLSTVSYCSLESFIKAVLSFVFFQTSWRESLSRHRKGLLSSLTMYVLLAS